MKPTLQFQFDSVQQLQLFVSKVVPVLEGSAPAEAVQAVKDSAAVYSPAVQVAESAPAPVPAVLPTAPAVPAPAPVPTVAPVQQTTLSGAIQAAEPMQTPTVAATYTADDLARAAVQLVDAGRQPELMPLLQKYGVNALPDLQEAQYAAFAADLRQLGVQV